MAREIDAPSVVSQLDMLFGELHSESLDPNESLAMIVQLAETRIET